VNIKFNGSKVRALIDGDGKTQVVVFLTMAAVWLVFIQSALHQRDSLWWFNYLIIARFFLLLLAVGFAVFVFFKKNINLISVYSLVCMLVQSSFSVLEGPKHLEYYEYISYFLLISTLSLKDDFNGWVRQSLPVVTFALVIPLLFKDSNYFTSIGIFAFSFTTPIAVIALSFIVARINLGKFQALQKNIVLSQKLLESESRNRELVEIELSRAKEKIERDAASVALSEVAQQVAHDIRAPVAFLNSTISQVQSLSEEHRTQISSAVNRIRDIANNLLKRSRSHGEESECIASSRMSDSLEIQVSSAEIVSVLVENALSEKRTQYQDRFEVLLHIDITSDASFAFAKVLQSDFNRLLSNLMDNAYEAFEGSSGNIFISVMATSNTISVKVRDNGKGMPEVVIKRIGERGWTYGKPLGTGLGLFHALETVRGWNGKLSFESVVGSGTTVTMTIPRVQSPAWALDVLKVKGSSNIIIIDDDSSVHTLLKSKIDKLNANICVISLFSASDIISWYRDNVAKSESDLFIFDYDLRGSNFNGLDLIEMFGTASGSILMTNRYEDSGVRERCVKLGIPILPKILAPVVPIICS